MNTITPYSADELEEIDALIAEGLTPSTIARVVIERGSRRTYVALVRQVDRRRSTHAASAENPTVTESQPQHTDDRETHIVGVNGDTRFPLSLPCYLDFVRETFARWHVDTVVHIGDMIDHHAISFHEHFPDGLSPGAEVTAALADVQEWVGAFPRLRWVMGNHDKLPRRKLTASGLPARMLRRNIYDIPTTWEQDESYLIDGVLYTHGTGSSGENGARNLARRRSVPCVVGHYHRAMGVAYTPSHDGGNLFGLQVGCGIEHTSYAMEYGRDYGRLALGCGVGRHGLEAYSGPMLRGWVRGWEQKNNRQEGTGEHA